MIIFGIVLAAFVVLLLIAAFYEPSASWAAEMDREMDWEDPDDRP
jgi:hypothetical protein